MQLGLYYRVSSLTQKENETIEVQRTLGRAYAHKFQHTIVREYEDNGVSGTSLEQRNGMLALLADAEHKMFEAVWVTDLDRFDRSSSSLEWAIIKDTLQSHHIILCTPNQTFDFTNDSQEFLEIGRASCRERVYVLV